MRIELHIEELILRGLPDQQPLRVEEAVARELSRLLREGAPRAGLAGDHAVNRVDGGSIEVDARPDVLGTRVAQAVHRSLR